MKSLLEAALKRCEGQIAELQLAVAEINETGGGLAQAVHTPHCRNCAALQERIASLESRVIEQEQTIRHTLTMLIEWIEQDEAHRVTA